MEKFFHLFLQWAILECEHRSSNLLSILSALIQSIIEESADDHCRLDPFPLHSQDESYFCQFTYQSLLCIFFTGCLAMKLVDTLGGKAMKISFITLLVILFKLDTTKKISNLVDSADDLAVSALSAVLFIYLFNLRIINKISIRFLNFLGNMTYAMYLLHFPVQLMIMLLVKPQDSHIFSEKWMLFIYVSVVIILSILCYRYFEQPMQSYLRKKDKGRFVNK